jgi:hypothetical protein
MLRSQKPQDRVLEFLREAKKLAQKYRTLTGKPLGITGEVAEYEAARLLGVELTQARQAGYDAIEHIDGATRHLQIKGRCLLPGCKPSQRLGSIDVTKEWDAVLMVPSRRELRSSGNLGGGARRHPPGTRRAGLNRPQRAWRARRQQVQVKSKTPLEARFVGKVNVMATLTTNDKQILEKLFQMGGGFVLNFSDRTIGEFFRDDIGVNIFDQKYNYASGSKANRLRGFWQVADDAIVGRSIDKFLEYIDNQIVLGNLGKADFSPELTQRARNVAARLQGRKAAAQAAPDTTEYEFISKEFGAVSIEKVGLDSVVSGILKQRIDEIRKCLTARAPLAVIFLCGSTLEGILLGIACSRPKEFNQSTVSPKDQLGKVKQFQDWTLSDFINVARDLNLVGEDVKKFSHALRDFRNYIHPYQQMASNFNPDEHTAKICWQVLQAAITQLSK